MINTAKRVPVFDGSIGPYISVAGDDAAHAAGVGGLDVALVVADIKTFFRRYADDLAGFEHRFRMRLGMRAGIAADQAGGALGIAIA